MARLKFVVTAASLLALIPLARAQDATARYDSVRKITVGGEGGWDFLEVDAANRRLHITRGNRVVVLDLDTEKVVGEIADTPGVHGVAFVPDLGRGVTSNGGDSSATIFDTKSLKILGKVKANGRPDIIYYDPVSRRIFTFNHGSNDTTAIDPIEMTSRRLPALGGVLKLPLPTMRAHLRQHEDTSEIVEFDARTLNPPTFPLAPGTGQRA